MAKDKLVLVPPEVVQVVRWERTALVDVGERMVCLTHGTDFDEGMPLLYRVSYTEALAVWNHAREEMAERLRLLEGAEYAAREGIDELPF